MVADSPPCRLQSSEAFPVPYSSPVNPLAEGSELLAKALLSFRLPGTKDTFVLPHLGHFDFMASCSEMVSVRSNFFPHLSQRYW